MLHRSTRWIAILLIIGGLLAVLVGCGATATPTSAPQAQNPTAPPAA
ncbi:MAG: hypothetical protein HY326_08140, partial [Chloroflexi bacterium]|nr:hypothetical protein [Chloroflexota bacterium]